MRSAFVIAAACACRSTVAPVTTAGPVTTPPAASPELVAVGVRTFEVTDPLSHAPIPAAVFYPATGAPGHTDIGPFRIEGVADAGAAAGRHPLVALSHGHGGTLWGHHDLAEALARAGYVVAVVEHAGDNFHDSANFRSDRVLLGRAYEISALIDAVLANPTLEIDHARIGVAGFSAGGGTSLLAIGAKPDLERVGAYCGRHGDDDEVCGGPVRRELASPRPTVDRRIKAAFVMAPFAIPYGEGAFADVTAPIFLSWAEADQRLLPAENAQLVLRAATLRGQRAYPGAGHYVFLAPCPAAMTAQVPEICTDPAGVDRKTIHQQIAADAVAFFDSTLR
jgi:predicted dienelactone hydrolase